MAQTPVSEPARAQRATVLVVEDDPDIGQALDSALDRHGYTVMHSADGKDALARLEQGASPDVILLDLMMPNMNGWEFRIEQRRHPQWAAIPVVVMSGDRSAQASAIDADAFVSKPVEPTGLFNTIDSLLVARERARLEARANELERMSSLGVLAAGIAHEINNPLASVVGNLELAQRKCSQLEAELPIYTRDPLRALGRLLSQAQRGSDRITEIVRNVATFSRPDTEQTVSIDVRQVLESSLELVGNELRHHAVLEREYDTVPQVVGNPAKLGQVFINLLINAAHAVRDRGADKAVVRVSTCVGEHGNVEVRVSDSGGGIPPELLARIFDPFFSTKPFGAGMGLGLAMCKGLVSSMGGTIRVQSTLGAGSTFVVSLPSQPEVITKESVPCPAAPAPALPSVLVIDDETMMCDLLCNLLEDDYRVSAISNPRTALKGLLRGESFDLVLCDLMMPELTGMDLHAELAKSRPEQASRFIFMTGGTFTEKARAFLDALDTPPLIKPFNHEKLRTVIEERLQKFLPQARAPSLH